MLSELFAMFISDQLSVWVLNIFIHATLLTAAALLISLLFRKTAVMRYWVLCFGLAFVSVSPVTAALIQATGSSWLQFSAVADSRIAATKVRPVFQNSSEGAIQQDVVDRSVPGSAIDMQINEKPTTAKSEPEVDHDLSTSETIPLVPQGNWTKTLLGLIVVPLIWIWLAGAFLHLIRLFLSCVRLSRILQSAKPNSNAQLQVAFDRACTTVGCSRRRPKLVTSNAIAGPIAAGVLNRKVVLPESLVLQVDPNLLMDVMVHEVAHIVRHDQIVILLQSIISAFFWPNPLVRKLNCELARAREEVCDNFVLAGTEASTYCRTLLSLAQLLQDSVATPSSVGFFTSRWKLEHRIAGLLDDRRKRTTSMNKSEWLFVTATFGMLAALTCLGTVTIANAQVGESQSTKSPIALKEISVRGLVLKPDGSPVDGAIVRVAAPVFGDIRRILGKDFESTITEVVTDEQGKFEISIDPKPYGNFPTQGTGWKDFWKKSVICATMPGFAGQFTKYEEVEGVDSVVLRLVEDIPIRGRVIDLEGRPISGVAIELKGILASSNESLDAWLSAVRTGESDWQAEKEMPRQIDARLLGVPKSVTTDRDGAFSIKGIGRERCLRLQVHGNGIAFDEFKVATRSMNPLTRNESGQIEIQESVYGAEFTYVCQPSRTVHGTVTDAKTGKPLAGVDVGVETISGKTTSGRWLLPTKSDSLGQFRIEGMPKGKGNRLMLLPSDDQPYFMREIEVIDSEGMGPVAMDIGLHRGIWIEGKVVDRKSREPVAGVRLHYLPFLTNKFANELPEFDLVTVDGQQDRYQTDLNGNYRLVGLPGPAVVGVESLHKPYLSGIGYNTLTVPKDRNGAQTYRNPFSPRPTYPDSMSEIDPKEDAERVQLDFELFPGQTINVSAVDESSDWLTGGVLIHGMARVTQRIKIERAPIEVNNIAPNESREIVVYHEKRGIGIVHHLTPAEIAEGKLLLTARPCASVSGRLVSNGEPLTGAIVTPAVAPTGDFSQSLASVRTDENGYFKAVLLPGCKYILRMEGKPFNYAHFDTEIEISPGESRELGTLTLSGDRTFKQTKDSN